MTHEEFARKKAEFYRMIAEPLPLAKPATRPTVTLPISHRLVEAVKINPQSVRIWARGADGVAFVERPNWVTA